ncbi:MAG: hypothetical protein NTY90_00280 [Candidatus Micrarchaeota archaeon]|nr:hypothetical protein [Candidatus Micrarchaeota archaeon]
MERMAGLRREQGEMLSSLSHALQMATKHHFQSESLMPRTDEPEHNLEKYRSLLHLDDLELKKKEAEGIAWKLEVNETAQKLHAGSSRNGWLRRAWKSVTLLRRAEEELQKLVGKNPELRKSLLEKWEKRARAGGF